MALGGILILLAEIYLAEGYTYQNSQGKLGLVLVGMEKPPSGLVGGLRGTFGGDFRGHFGGCFVD